MEGISVNIWFLLGLRGVSTVSDFADMGASLWWSGRLVGLLAWLVLVPGSCMLWGCNGITLPWVQRIHTVPAESGAFPRAEQFHLVRKGETLYSIAWSYGLTYQQLGAWNNISPPDYTIFPSQKVFLLPPVHESNSSDSPRKQARMPARVEDRTQDDFSLSLATFNDGWGRPLLVGGRSSSIRYQRHQNGLQVSGKGRFDVLSVADGVVVYEGREVKFYDTLILIKHKNDFFSAYAHCDKLLVREGQTVKRGQPIAEINFIDHPLYLEIRRKNIAVDPYSLLPS